MNALKLIPIVMVVACAGPSKQDAAKVFAAATAQMSSAQSTAVTSARNASLAPAQLSIAYSGACLSGGTVAVTGNYDGTGTGQDATFDLTTTFNGCRSLDASLDGSLTWNSVAAGGAFSASMTGSLDYADSQTTASCDFDLHLAVSSAQVTYSGTVCGYDVQTDLRI